MSDRPLLYPTPRTCTRFAGTVTATATVIRHLDPALVGDEAYRLRIADDQITLTARTPTGLRWADATLTQIRAQNGHQLPALLIEDAPAFAQRGFMLDISRDRVPTLATLRGLVDVLVSLKGNRLQLYIEHTLAYAGHATVWAEASPLTLADLDTLDAYCRERDVALDANQNCLGHYERWLKHPAYSDLAELPAPQMVKAPWGDWFSPRTTLNPLDERSFALVSDLLTQQLPACSGEFANIGCDEPFDLGYGRSATACATEGKGRIYSRWVTKVARLVQNLGKRPQYWCDPHPNEDDGLPRDLLALVWGYEYDEDFATRIAAHCRAGREVWVAPGTGGWASYLGRTSYRRENLTRAAAQAAAATGMLVTEWGDQGHQQPWPVTLFGLADGMQAAWSGSSHFDDAAAGQAVFGDPAAGRWLAEAGEADGELTRQSRNISATFRDAGIDFLSADGSGTREQWQACSARLDALRATLPAGWWADEARLGLELSRWAADRAVVRRAGTGSSLAERSELSIRLCGLIPLYRRQWLARCGAGGLEDSMARLRHHV